MTNKYIDKKRKKDNIYNPRFEITRDTSSTLSSSSSSGAVIRPGLCIDAAPKTPDDRVGRGGP